MDHPLVFLAFIVAAIVLIPIAANRLAPHTAPRLEPLVDKLIAIRNIEFLFAALFVLGLCAVCAAAGITPFMPFIAVGGFAALIAAVVLPIMAWQRAEAAFWARYDRRQAQRASRTQG